MMHVIWSGRFSDEIDSSTSYIFYRRWDGRSWTEPVDILVDPAGGSSSWPEAVVDNAGILHVIWAASGSVFHSAVITEQASFPYLWSQPRKLGTGNGGVVSKMGLAVAPDGSVHAVFSEVLGEVYHVVSFDNGNSWSDPTPVSTSPSSTMTRSTALAIGPDGVLYVVWGQVPLESFPYQGVLFASSSDNGTSWSTPVQLAEDYYGEPNVAANGPGQVHVIYNAHVNVSGKYYRESVDGGLTWADPVALLPPGSPGMGLNGPPNLVADALGNLYFLGGGDHFWLLQRQNGQWSPPQDMTITLDERTPETLGYTENPTFCVLNGNQLHFVFYDVPIERELNRLWHTWRTISAPASPMRAFPTVIPVASPTAKATAIIPTSTRTVSAQAFSDREKPRTVAGSLALITAIGSSSLVIGLFLAISLRRRKL